MHTALGDNGVSKPCLGMLAQPLNPMAAVGHPNPRATMATRALNRHDFNIDY